MDEDFIFFTEILLFFVCAVFTVRFLHIWYKSIVCSWPKERARGAKTLLGLLPIAALIGFVALLINVSRIWLLTWPDMSEGEVFFYILIYTVFGFAWINFSVFVFSVMGISWQADALHSNNKAALFTIAGGFLGIAALYAGANYYPGEIYGTGDGWWTILFSGGLATILFFLFALLINLCTNIFERIVSGRDVGAGIRLGAFLLSAGILLARSASGDWTGALNATIELLDGWPVLALALLVIGVERIFLAFGHAAPKKIGFSSLAIALIYLSVGIVGAIPEFFPSIADIIKGGGAAI